ncbi:MAG: ribulose-phosphate 3-epimerase [Micropruina sp.]|nr:ribulose-phosphate 3-epimerase [Micropruina sp.]
MRITPSVLNANLANLESEIARIPSADGIHLDVMDNRFVPNLTFGLPVIECVRKATTAFLDVHLMIAEVDRWAPGYAEIGCDSVTFHIEASDAPIKLARELRALGSRASMALRPATPIEPYADLLGELDMVLVMSVEPGFGGQKFLDLVLPKLRRTRELVARTGQDIWIQVDGGISEATIERCVDAGADTFVAGSAVYSAADPDAMVRALKAQAAAQQDAAHHHG